jgi:hypothetical protein
MEISAYLLDLIAVPGGKTVHASRGHALARSHALGQVEKEESISCFILRLRDWLNGTESGS